MTSAEITTIASAISLGVLQAYTIYKTRQTAKTVDVVHRLVNAPLGVALSGQADAKETVAKMTAAPADILSANVARKQSDDHKEAADALKK